LAHLPVPIGEGAFQRLLNEGTIEGGQCNDGSTANRGAVAEGGENRRQAGGVPDGPECCDGRLATEGVIMARGDATQLGHASFLADLADGKAGRFDHRRVLVVQQWQEVRSYE
jgi:hypothetical protein